MQDLVYLQDNYNIIIIFQYVFIQWFYLKMCYNIKKGQQNFIILLTLLLLFYF